MNYKLLFFEGKVSTNSLPDGFLDNSISFGVPYHIVDNSVEIREDAPKINSSGLSFSPCIIKLDLSC